jgi:hypothetical protein
MSENEAIVVSPANSEALQMGGIGIGAGMFKARPSMIELVHKSSHAEGVKYGEFRIIGSNEHLGTKIRVVLLAVPQIQKEWFRDPAVFTKENKACFSLDGIRPHPRAQDPPAMYCATCDKGDKNWITWRKTKLAKDLPPCGAYWHLLLALRDTQTPHYLNVKGKSYLPFKQAMEQQMTGLLQKMMANVKALNRTLGYTLVTLEQAGVKFQEFRPTPEFVAPEGGQKPQVAMPNIFDISFDITSWAKDGGPFQMRFDKFAAMSPEDKAEFGQLYLDIAQQRIDLTQANSEVEEDEAAVTEEPASTVAPQQEILAPSTPAPSQITI